MFEKFDGEARQAIIKAHELATCGGYPSIRPTHIAIAAALVLEKGPQMQHQMPFTPSSTLHLRLLDPNKTITAEDLYEQFKGR